MLSLPAPTVNIVQQLGMNAEDQRQVSAEIDLRVSTIQDEVLYTQTRATEFLATNNDRTEQVAILAETNQGHIQQTGEQLTSIMEQMRPNQFNTNHLPRKSSQA